jgi:hypothetical protein
MIKAQLNISEVAEAADLEALVRGICGPGDGKGKYICPFHDDHTPSLEITRHSALSHGVTSWPDSSFRNSAGVSLRNSPKLISGTLRLSRP